MLKRWCVILLLMSLITWLGCESEQIPAPVDCSVDPVELDLVSVTDANCTMMDGRIEVNATGGTGSYRYKLGNGEEQTSPAFGSLGAALYEITAIDGNNCSATIEVSVMNINGMNIAFDISESGCKKSDGTLTVTAFDGTEPYQFKLDDGSFTASNTFAGLAGGAHNLVVNDASGCEINQTVNIKSGVSYASSISPIIENKCAISDCHSGTYFPDFRVLKNVRDNAGQVKTLTGNGTMPADGTLTQAEKDLIACWVDDGAPDN